MHVCGRAARLTLISGPKEAVCRGVAVRSREPWTKLGQSGLGVEIGSGRGLRASPNRQYFQVLVHGIRTYGRVVHRPVPFVQHPSGIKHLGLWKGVFFIACKFPWAKVTVRRRGASPSRPVWDPACVLGFWVVRGEIRGPSRGAAPAEDRTLPPEVNTEEQQ